jgi:hypothetical protein
VLAASRHRLRRARMHRGPEVRGESAASYRRDAAVSSAL